MNNILSGDKFPTDDPTCGYTSLGAYCQAKLREHANKVLLVINTLYGPKFFNNFDIAMSKCYLQIMKFQFQVNYSTKEEITGAQLLSRCTKLARSLRAHGICPGDTVALCSANDPDFGYVMIACFLLGAAFEPLATNYADLEIIHVLSLARPSVIFATSDSIEQISRIADQLKFIKNVFVYDNDYGRTHDGTDRDVDTFVCQPQDVCSRTAIILLSSGTTGMPKGVELTQLNIFASFYIDYMYLSYKTKIWKIVKVNCMSFLYIKYIETIVKLMFR